MFHCRIAERNFVAYETHGEFVQLLTTQFYGTNTFYIREPVFMFVYGKHIKEFRIDKRELGGNLVSESFVR
jgi:hypothetical protein